MEKEQEVLPTAGMLVLTTCVTQVRVRLPQDHLENAVVEYVMRRFPGLDWPAKVNGSKVGFEIFHETDKLDGEVTYGAEVRLTYEESL
jgi:hypothetical protein